MLRLLPRLLVGALGVLALIGLLRLWTDPAIPAATLGLSPIGGLGLATLRADVAGFFGGMGAFALAAAIRNDRRLVTVPLVLVSLALVGRLITAGMEGLAPDMVMPMAVEATLAVLLAIGRRTLGTR
ncbi:hypothetical protein JKL49_16670 [Phenylobacterium sp. 20VBR1]|uniref:DUF4345 domain-containing protein n=1 Tax=Phenylobacterium glaciei TaxID=2803784 RepID=A0A941D451_9CAUL|nr:hypothetical protein [Phenylobacterium glaciei]MBR7621029.1 hypothetical protein [Phenylobacterium glaciei]